MYGTNYQEEASVSSFGDVPIIYCYYHLINY